MMRRALSIVLAFFVGMSVLFAQEDPNQATPKNSLFVRPTSHGALLSIYSYSPGGAKPIVTAAFTGDMSAYREYLLGGGVNLGNPSHGITLYAMGVDATDSRYVELWAYPWVETKWFAATAFIGYYVPLQHVGIRQWFVDPANAFVKINQRIAVGVNYDRFAIEGPEDKASAGPSLRVMIPKGNVVIDYHKGLKNFENEIRASLQLNF